MTPFIAPRVPATSSAVCKARSSRSSWRRSPAATNTRGARRDAAPPGHDQGAEVRAGGAAGPGSGPRPRRPSSSWRGASGTSYGPPCAHPQHDPLPRLEHAGLTEGHGVKDAERLPDFGPAARCQGRWSAVAVHLLRPLREHGDRGVADILPEIGDLLI